jgi:uncharacterized membrane protein YidH (DUF202 family)
MQDHEQDAQAILAMSAFAGIVMVQMVLVFLAATVDTVAPATGSAGNTELMTLGGLALVVIGIAYLARSALRRLVCRVDRWRRESREAQHAALCAAAIALSMSIEQDPRGGHPVLVGKRDGTWLRLHLTKSPHLIASHRLPLPAAFSLTAGAGGERVGNPVLDALLTPSGVESVTIDWADPHLTGLLIEALHGHPGSTINAHTLTMHNINADDLPAALDLTCAVVGALRSSDVS